MASDGCPEYQDDVTSFVLGDLHGEARGRLVAHLEICSACRRETAALNAALDSISGATVAVEPRPDFVERVMSAAEEARLTAPSRPVPVRRPAVTVVMRRRRTVLGLSASTCLLAIMAAGGGSWFVSGLAIFFGALEVAYLALVAAVTHTKARDELAPAAVDDSWWRGLDPVVPPIPAASPEAVITPVVAVDNVALVRFVISYFTGCALTPIVGAIRLVRGDLEGIEHSPVLGRIVALQRHGRSQSLRLLAAGVTTVAVAGGGATLVIAPGVAAAAPTQTYVVHTLSTPSGAMSLGPQVPEPDHPERRTT